MVLQLVVRHPGCITGPVHWRIREEERALKPLREEAQLPGESSV
jgi:hypothetical protein